MTGAPDPYAGRAARYGSQVLTYRDPELLLSMLEPLDINVPLRVLDLAAGQGDATRHLRAIGADIIYVDRSDEMLAAGISRGLIPPAHAVRHALNDIPLPFPESSFDIATIRYALHDITHKLPLFHDVSRILKPTGTFQVVDMCSTDPEIVDFLNTIHTLKATTDSPDPVRIAGQSTLHELATAAGFVIGDVRWYRSNVSSAEWVAEEQISEAREGELRQRAEEWGVVHPSQAHELGLELGDTSFRISFPVIILTLRRQGADQK